jgi:hypothetical protein
LVFFGELGATACGVRQRERDAGAAARGISTDCAVASKKKQSAAVRAELFRDCEVVAFLAISRDVSFVAPMQIQVVPRAFQESRAPKRRERRRR